MKKLNSVQILQEEETRDPSKITSLKLTEKALSDVSCLVDFKNLERLDLRFNNLTSLEGLKYCVNLKWLSVIQNKLQTLKGIEGLSKLTVLNAGKNKLKSIDEVASLVSLGALILNDNEIVSVCDLSPLTTLNTLVLSRNPVRKIGRALNNLKSLEKLSLTECQLQSIGSSFKSCTNLKELRLNKNEIKTLPSELAQNARLWELELGNNSITSWSDVEQVLKSLTHLKSLNLHGNPISDNDKLVKKIKALLPTLRKFNGKNIHKDENQKFSIDESSLNVSSGQQMENPEKNTHVSDSIDANFVKASEDVDKKSKRKKRKAEIELPVREISVPKEEKVPTKRDLKGKISKKLKRAELEVIDDGETSFSDLFAVSDAGNPRENDQMKTSDKAKNSLDPTVIIPAKKKKSKGLNAAALHELLQGVEIGMGGPSAWGDE